MDNEKDAATWRRVKTIPYKPTLKGYVLISYKPVPNSYIHYSPSTLITSNTSDSRSTTKEGVYKLENGKVGAAYFTKENAVNFLIKNLKADLSEWKLEDLN